MNSTPPKIFGLIGYPVRHSFSPIMHNAAFKHLGINAEYRLFPVKPEDLEPFLLDDIIVQDVDGKDARAKDIAGFNITIPHKIRAKEILETHFPPQPGGQVETEEQAIVCLTGAVNTVKRENGRLFFQNTDAVGFSKSLKQDLSFNKENKTVLLLGCGGAGRAVVSALTVSRESARKVYIFEINNEVIPLISQHFLKSSLVKGKFEFVSKENLPEIISECQLLINASPLGMQEGDGSVVNKSLLHKNLSIYDVVYHRETQLIKDAKSLGLPAAGGLGMLLYQGTAAFEFWTGNPAPIEIMRQALIKTGRYA
ncbi:MAG: shikimate dehydrogenase [Candidatus Omnitrophota bacterium]